MSRQLQNFVFASITWSKRVPLISATGVNQYNSISDVLSFYKEELVGENGNYVSLEASQKGQEKIPVLRELARDVFLCVSRVESILEGTTSSSEAKAAFQCFKGGYVSLHTSLDSRYHLNDLFPSQ